MARKHNDILSIDKNIKIVEDRFLLNLQNFHLFFKYNKAF